MAEPLDLAKPMHLRAEMARRGLVFHQLLPYDDPERGHTDPLDDPEVKVEVRRFMGQVWQAALHSEAAQAGPVTAVQERLPLDARATRGASRHDGPDTSREGGRSLSGQNLRDQQALVLEAVVACGERGANAHDVQTWCRGHDRPCPERNAIGSRFAELSDMGMVDPAGDRPGATGRPQHVFTATEAGRSWVAALQAERGAA